MNGNREYKEWRKRVAHAKAVNRGKITVAWNEAGNKLTPETHEEFKRLMKKADKEFDEKSVA